MLKNIGPKILKTLKSPKPFVNPYCDEIFYADDTVYTTRNKLNIEYPDWFFVSIEEILLQNEHEFCTFKTTSMSHRKLLGSRSHHKEIILDVCREFVKLLAPKKLSDTDKLRIHESTESENIID